MFLPTTCFMAVGPSPGGPFHRLPHGMAAVGFQGEQSEREWGRNSAKIEATVFS